MSTATVSTCSCGSIGRSDLRQCPEHFHIWNGDRRLPSIGSIVRQCWPPPKSPPPPDVLENARDRGSEVDKLFAGYVLGTLMTIPAGTRHDARDLFLKLVKWYDRQGFKRVEAQVLLAAEDHGGILDFTFDEVPFELKSTYDVGHEHRMQAAGYSNIAKSNGNILHVTERYAEPRVVPLTQADYVDWESLLNFWRVVQRRAK